MLVCECKLKNEKMQYIRDFSSIEFFIDTLYCFNKQFRQLFPLWMFAERVGRTNTTLRSIEPGVEAFSLLIRPL